MEMSVSERWDLNGNKKPYPIARLDDDGNIINIFHFLLPRSLKTLHGSNPLVQLAFHYCELSCHFKRLNVKKLELLRCLWYNWLGRGALTGICYHLDHGIASFLLYRRGA